MIIRVWGIVNSGEVEFTPVKNKPGYWEGLAPRAPDLQEVEIWAESDSGARGHLKCTVQIEHTPTHTRLILFPYIVEKLERYMRAILPQRTETRLLRCRKVCG